MKYFKIQNRAGKPQRWVECEFDSTKKQVTLYNDDFTILGIGLY